MTAVSTITTTAKAHRSTGRRPLRDERLGKPSPDPPLLAAPSNAAATRAVTTKSGGSTSPRRSSSSKLSMSNVLFSVKIVEFRFKTRAHAHARAVKSIANRAGKEPSPARSRRFPRRSIASPRDEEQYLAFYRCVSTSTATLEETGGAHSRRAVLPAAATDHLSPRVQAAAPWSAFASARSRRCGRFRRARDARQGSEGQRLRLRNARSRVRHQVVRDVAPRAAEPDTRGPPRCDARRVHRMLWCHFPWNGERSQRHSPSIPVLCLVLLSYCRGLTIVSACGGKSGPNHRGRDTEMLPI